MLVRALLLAISCLTASTGAELPRAAPAEVGLSQQRLDRITRALESSVERNHVAGAIGVVARRGKIAYWKAVGMADRESGTAMVDGTIFRIYSMTKPIVSVALMMLYEEGRFSLRDEVRQHLPALGDLKVWVDGKLESPVREMTVQDLMRHTAGLTYGLFGDSHVDKLYNDAQVLSGNRTVAEFVEKLAKLPLKHQPGTQWDYSVSVDVQGRLIEVLSGMDLASYLRERVFKPLDMRDTSFRIAQEQRSRFAQVYKKTKDEQGIEPAGSGRADPYAEDTKWYSGGGGLISTTRDYLRFCQMLLNGGALDGTRILSRKTVELMTIDHTVSIARASSILDAGYGFGLNFAVHVDPARSGLNGSVGEYNWSGLAGTSFWVDPAEDLIGIYMIQMMPPRHANGAGQFKQLVYQSIAD